MKNDSDGPGRGRLIGGLLIVSLLGLLCVVAPVLGTSPLMPAPLFPLIRTAVEKLTWVPIAALGGLGLAIGLGTRLPCGRAALASIAILPAVAIAEIIADSSTHNLIPFEIGMYLFMALPVWVMAMVGRRVRGGRVVAAESGERVG